MADTIGHANTQTRPVSLRRHPIITAPKWTTTAAMAVGTGLNAHCRPVLPWPGRGGCPGCPNSAAPAQHPVLLRLGCFVMELPQTRAPTRNALHPTRQQAGSGLVRRTRWGEGNTWHPLHFSVIADAMGSGLGSTHGNILSCLRNLNCKVLLLL